MFRRLRGTRPAAIVTAGVAVGLFVSHVLSDFVPDALAIGVCMFSAGALAGLLVGLTHTRSDGMRPAAAHSPRQGREQSHP